MKRLGIWLPLTAVALVGCIIAQAPAALLVSGMQRQLPDLRVSGVSGTLWHGRAYGLSWSLQGQAMALATLDWSVPVLPLLGLRPAVDLRGSREQQNFRLRLSKPLGHRLALEQLELELELPARVVPALADISLRGRISAEVEQLTLDDDKVAELNGRIVLQDAVLVGPAGPQALGSFVAELTERDGNLVAELFDLDGPGQLKGNFKLDLGGGYQLESVLAPREGNTALGDWLALIGEPVGGDRYRIVSRGQLW